MILLIKECKFCRIKNSCEFKSKLKNHLKSIKGEFSRTYLSYKCNNIIPLLTVGQWVEFTIAWFDGYQDNEYGDRELCKNIETFKGQYSPKIYNIENIEPNVEPYVYHRKKVYRIKISKEDAEYIKSKSKVLEDLIEIQNDEYYFNSLYKYLKYTKLFNIRK